MCTCRKTNPYANDRIFKKESGCSNQSYFITVPFGSSLGGSGLMMSSRDLMRLAILISQHGHSFDGAQLLPESY